MKTPSPELMNMWRETTHVHMRMILLCLESGRSVPQGLRKRTYGPEFLEYLEERRSEYSKKLAELPSPTEKAPEYGRHYVVRVHSHAQALDAVRRELKHLNLRVDLDDSQKRQKRPGIIRRYIELRRGFSEWLKQWEEEANHYGGEELYFRKPTSSEPDYKLGQQYRWYYRFKTVTEYNNVIDLEAHSVSTEILALRTYLELGTSAE